MCATKHPMQTPLIHRTNCWKSQIPVLNRIIFDYVEKLTYLETSYKSILCLMLRLSFLRTAKQLYSPTLYKIEC
ncbi:hypothetical protein QE152_g37473 [Popillia japonica]|uniref:Uncharacterized protein n=1 Tax=Popillia japonica TaxID=7064 RepID=A0AAW1IA87_POPJA